MEPRPEPAPVEREREEAAAPLPGDGREHCPQCGRTLEPHRCKLVCRCGYFMSCSEF